MLQNWTTWLEHLRAEWAEGQPPRDYPIGAQPTGTEPEPTDAARTKHLTSLTPELLAQLERHRGQWLT